MESFLKKAYKIFVLEIKKFIHKFDLICYSHSVLLMINTIKKITPVFIHPFLRTLWANSLKLVFRFKEILLFLELIFYKSRGKSFFGWYVNKLNSWAINTKKFKDKNSKANKDFLISGKDDLDVLKKLGLKKKIKLLEYGCGWLRSAFHFINFLDKKLYIGVDPAINRIDKGKVFFKIDNLKKSPKFIVNKNNDFDFLINEKVDMIWCHAVFGHLPPKDITCILQNAKKIMHFKTKFVFTYHKIISHKKSKSKHKHFNFFNFFNFDKNIKRLNVRDWHHNYEFYKNIGDKVGLEIKHYPDILKNYKYINKDFGLCVASIRK